MSGMFSGGKTESKMKSTLTKQQLKAQDKLGPYLTSKIGTGLPGYAGQLSATLGDEYGESQSYLQDVMGGKFSSKDYLEPYFKTNIQDPLMESWKEDILPEIGGISGNGGFFYGSGRERLERESAEDLLETLGSERTKLYYQANEAERARQMEASNLSLQAAMGKTAVEQGALTREQEEWLRTQPEYNHMLSMVLSFLGGNYMAPTTTETGPGLLNSAITGFATGYGQGLGDVSPSGKLIFVGNGKGFGYLLPSGIIATI